MSSAPASQESEDDGMDDCPICVEPFDESDRLFFPCQCNYQVCMFCVRRLMTEFDGRCPGCRAVYNEANFRIKELEPEEVERRKQREKLRKQQLRNPPALVQQSSNSSVASGSVSTSAAGNKAVRPATASTAPPTKKPASATHLSPLGGPTSNNDNGDPTLAQQRNSLANVRVIQKHVVFVLGLPLSLAKDDILRRPEHFGQYGTIVKIVVGHPASAPGRTASASAHITFQRAEDAQQAIRGVDGRVLDGHQIRASFGTTRYCQSFLRGQQCPNPNCLFLHQEVDSSAQTLPNPQSAVTAAGTGQRTNGTASSFGRAERSHQPAFGGTDPFATENVSPEPLNGIDLTQYEKQRGGGGLRSGHQTPSLPAMTKSRAPGSDRPVPTSSPTTSQPPSYDCALSLVAELVVGRGPMPADLKKTLCWITGPRTKSSQFSGLECVLVGSSPMFIAPVSAPVELKDAPEMEQVLQSAMATAAGGLDGGKEGDMSQSNQFSNQQDKFDAAKDKKLSRKNKKAAFAAQNRIGGEDSY